MAYPDASLDDEEGGEEQHREVAEVSEPEVERPGTVDRSLEGEEGKGEEQLHWRAQRSH